MPQICEIFLGGDFDLRNAHRSMLFLKSAEERIQSR